MKWKIHVKKQIDKRQNPKSDFSIQDHIRGMVYSMLSSGVSWDKYSIYIDDKTGHILEVDKIFSDYDAEALTNTSPCELVNNIQHCISGTPYLRKQMEALFLVNIPKLKCFIKKYGTIDAYYQKWISPDGDLKPLIKRLSDRLSEDKLKQLGIPLVCEYLKNVGYEVGKPDRHIRRILGSNRLGFSSHETAPEWEALNIIKELGDKTQKSPAEVDYILWMYCAKGFGAVCTAQNPNCTFCIVKEMCNHIKK